ncbi:MAG: hypothetical protein JO199_03490, partial [Candidatus Eremiobacteraeota bacterium]|nr:hypothetical protein [Candidatus Eremiobacteraeota bacterium]
ERWRAWWPLAAVAAVCFVLSIGPAFPPLNLLWMVLGQLPLLRDVRTPDRFEQINALFIALGAAYGASILARGTRSARAVAIALAAATVVGYAAFDVREHVLALQSVEESLPDFHAVSAAVEAIGGRTAVVGFPLRGSPYDWAPYAPRSPRVTFAWDLVGRFGKTDAGVALLRRAAVRSIVTTPVWTRYAPDGTPGDMSDLVRHSPLLSLAGRFPNHVNVFAVRDPRPMIASVRALCAYAGPAAFELAAGLKAFDGNALVHGSGETCAPQLLADYDPRDAALPKSAVAMWSGVQAFGASGPFPSPNAFEIDRFGITQPWYRNQYRGDSLVGTAPYLTSTAGRSVPLQFDVARAGAYAMYARLSGVAALRCRCIGGRIVVAKSRRLEGFGWVTVPLGVLPPGKHAVRLELIDEANAPLPAVADVVLVSAIAPSAGVRAEFTVVSSRSFDVPSAHGVDWSATQYFARGSYAWSSATSAVALSVDDRPWLRGNSAILNDGYHVLKVPSIRGLPPIVFRRLDAAATPAPSPIALAEQSATSWNVRTSAASTLELAELDDGNWFARGTSQTTYGYTCDLVNTCFDVDAGDVYVSRRIPPLLALGYAITLADLAVALGLLFLAGRPQHVPSSGRSTNAA